MTAIYLAERSNTKLLSGNNMLRHLAFDNSAQANIISIVSNGKIIVANSAACKLLGYSKKELLTKNRAAIFDINETGFKKMLKQRMAEGQSKALVTAMKKNGNAFPAEITSAVFMDEDGIEKSITSIVDISQRIEKQKQIDSKKEKIVAHNIVLAKSEQKEIDSKKKKKVVDNIILAQAKSDARLAENNEWIKYIGETSFDVMWDWDIATGKIYVSDSIEEVFGYKVQNNTVSFGDFGRCLIPEEKEAVEKRIIEALASGNKTWNDSYRLKRHDGSVAYTICRASIIRDKKGKALSLVGAIQDVSRLRELEKKLEEQIVMKKEYSEVFQIAAKLSYDGIWDWNILTNDFFLGEGFEELFGYDLKKNKGNMADWSKHLHPEDKEAVEKGLQDAIASSATRWEHAYRFIKADGTIAKVFGRADIIRNADGKASRMIGAIHDLSKQNDLEIRLDYEMTTRGKMLVEYEQQFKLIFNSSSDILYDVDLVLNEIILSDAYEKQFGYKLINNMATTEEWFSHIHPADKEEVIQDYQRLLTSKDGEWNYSFRFVRSDDSVANVLTKGIVLRNSAGNAYRGIGYMQDISKQKVLEERLDQEIRLKEKEIAEAREEAKETERLDIGKELHDNVNQLLGASGLYLNMAKQGGEGSEMYLSRSSEYMHKAIEEIRKLTKGLTTGIINSLGICEAIYNVSQDAMEVAPVKISCALEVFIEDKMSDKFKLNIFRIVQEQLNNILKHSKATEATISLSQNEKFITLSISDNGVGFDTSKIQEGIGLANIKSRAVSYNGTAYFLSRPSHGCVLTVNFPVTDALL